MKEYLQSMVFYYVQINSRMPVKRKFASPGKLLSDIILYYYVKYILHLVI